MTCFSELQKKLAVYLPQDQIDKIAQAYLVAKEAHAGQTRHTGEPYITHPLSVAAILAELRMDHQCLMAALLHDVLEDTSLDKEAIQSTFGEKIAELVDGVSKLEQITFESKAIAQAESFRKMMLAMAKDIRVILIKLADRLHNMRTLKSLPPEKRRRIASETLEVYAPIAHRLGINHMRVEFEELGFLALHPLRYRALEETVQRARKSRLAVMQTVEKKLKSKLRAAGVRWASVLGRERHLYSLYKKMRKKRRSLSEVLDVYAFRIVVKKEEACYRALGVVHALYPPISQCFRDYIAIPKANGYQSLHTTVMGPHGIPMEIQIRTEEMDRFAENGIASHWLYKQVSLEKEALAENHHREWLHDLVEMQKKTGNPLEFIENVKSDFLSDAVYVFTPKGSIFSLPKGATPVDFAYLIHTDIGNTCVGCKIDRRLAPLNARLKNGQTVDIVTDEKAHPNPAWLTFAVTGKARSNIRHWLKNLQDVQSQALGKRLLDSVLQEVSLSLEADFPENMLELLALELGVPSVAVLYEEIGLGKRLAPLVAQYLLNRQYQQPFDEKQRHVSLTIKGTEGLVVGYAQCCYPIPGDWVVGILVSGQGVVVHQERCPKILKFKEKWNQCVHVEWEEKVVGEFQVPILVDVVNEKGVLAAIATAIADSNANIMHVQIEEGAGHYHAIKFIIIVRSRVHLAKIMRRVRTVLGVLRLHRG